MFVYDVYFAAPFFNFSEREINKRLVSSLEEVGLRVFLPSRDGIVAKETVGKSACWEDISAQVWKCDTDAILGSELVLAVIDGRAIDEGVCVEIGFAAAHGKKIIAFSSDDRKQFPWGNNPMVIHPITKLISDPDLVGSEVYRILKDKKS